MFTRHSFRRSAAKGFMACMSTRPRSAKGVKVTGATVHFVSEVVDGGAIILQKAVEVEPDDTPETLQQRVMREAEWKILPRAVSLYCEGRLTIADGKVHIS